MFGCSWTWGRFINVPLDRINHDNLLSTMPFEKEQAELYSYRALISQHFDTPHINFSEGASSNDRQFRYATQHFIGPDNKFNNFVKINGSRLELLYNRLRDVSWPSFEQACLARTLPVHILDELIQVHQVNDFEYFRPEKKKKYVIWFITSTARKEFYNATKAEFENIMLATPTTEMSKLYLTDYYDHTKELEKLSQQMQLWNYYFESQGIINVWVDTFNHHDYPISVNNKLDFGTGFSDLMSNMCVLSGFTPKKHSTHSSAWSADDERSEHLVKIGLLNQMTLHPTQQGHKIIAQQLLIPQLEKFFNQP